MVEDHDSFRGIVCTALRSYLPGWQVFEAASICDAKAVMKRNTVEVIASDMSLPDGTAKDLVDSLQGASSARVIVFSNYSSDDLQPLLSRGVVHAFVPKDRGVKALADSINKVFSISVP